jgi:hemerythrin-like domain-containing protein
MSKAIDDLMNEHEAVNTAIQILDVMINKVESTQSMDEKDMHEMLEFLREFVDRCHHGKEELHLFPAMVSAGVPEQGGPIGVLLAEHAQGRQLIRAMEASMAAEVDRNRLSHAAREYSSLYRIHIHKENGIMFPMANRVLSESQKGTVFAGFEEIEETVVGHERHAELLNVLGGLKEKYLV